MRFGQLLDVLMLGDNNMVCIGHSEKVHVFNKDSFFIIFQDDEFDFSDDFKSKSEISFSRNSIVKNIQFIDEFLWIHLTN